MEFDLSQWAFGLIGAAGEVDCFDDGLREEVFGGGAGVSLGFVGDGLEERFCLLSESFAWRGVIAKMFEHIAIGVVECAGFAVCEDRALAAMQGERFADRA